jgi:hypothetical protein
VPGCRACAREAPSLFPAPLARDWLGPWFKTSQGRTRSQSTHLRGEGQEQLPAWAALIFAVASRNAACAGGQGAAGRWYRTVMHCHNDDRPFGQFRLGGAGHVGGLGQGAMGVMGCADPCRGASADVAGTVGVSDTYLQLRSRVLRLYAHGERESRLRKAQKSHRVWSVALRVWAGFGFGVGIRVQRLLGVFLVPGCLPAGCLPAGGAPHWCGAGRAE